MSTLSPAGLKVQTERKKSLDLTHLFTSPVFISDVGFLWIISEVI